MAEDWGGLAGLPAIFGRTTVHRHRRLVNYCNRLDSTNVGIIFMRSGSSARAWSGTSGSPVQYYTTNLLVSISTYGLPSTDRHCEMPFRPLAHFPLASPNKSPSVGQCRL